MSDEGSKSGTDATYDEFEWGDGGTCAMRVATRIRPLSGVEKERKERNAWKIEDTAGDRKSGRKASRSSVLKASPALEKALQSGSINKSGKRTPGRTSGRKGKGVKGKGIGGRRMYVFCCEPRVSFRSGSSRRTARRSDDKTK